MVSTSKLNHWALSISTTAITVVGTVSPIFAPVVAQAAYQCTPQTPQEGSPLPGDVPHDVRLQAQAAANAVPNVPDVTLTHFRSEIENNVRIWKLNGRQSDNNCLLEVEVISTAPSSDTQANVRKIKRQLPTLSLLPFAVSGRLSKEGFTIVHSEYSTIDIEFVPPGPVPPFEPVSNSYSLTGICTANILPLCTVGVTGKVKINANGTTLLFKRALLNRSMSLPKLEFLSPSKSPNSGVL